MPVLARRFQHVVQGLLDCSREFGCKNSHYSRADLSCDHIFIIVCRSWVQQISGSTSDLSKIAVANPVDVIACHSFNVSLESYTCLLSCSLSLTVWYVPSGKACSVTPKLVTIGTLSGGERIKRFIVFYRLILIKGPLWDH